MTLVRLAPPAKETQESADEFRPLFAKLKAAPDDRPILLQSGKGGGVNALANRLRNGQPPEHKSNFEAAQLASFDQGSPAPSANTPSRGLSSLGNQPSDSNGEATGRASTGNLWGAVEPCWRNLGARGRVPVVLEVDLNNGGGLRNPPKVIRTTTALIDEPRLQAEASALTALAACVPRGDPRFSGGIYRLEFPAAR